MDTRQAFEHLSAVCTYTVDYDKFTNDIKLWYAYHTNRSLSDGASMAEQIIDICFYDGLVECFSRLRDEKDLDAVDALIYAVDRGERKNEN